MEAMPISPEILARVVPGAEPDTWQTGERLGMSKDILLPYSSMKLDGFLTGFCSRIGCPTVWLSVLGISSSQQELFGFFAAGRKGSCLPGG